MPRMGRVMLPSHPHHVVQRGHNRQVVFAEVRDYLRYLDAFAEFKVGFRETGTRETGTDLLGNGDWETGTGKRGPGNGDRSI